MKNPVAVGFHGRYVVADRMRRPSWAEFVQLCSEVLRSCGGVVILSYAKRQSATSTDSVQQLRITVVEWSNVHT